MTAHIGTRINRFLRRRPLVLVWVSAGALLLVLRGLVALVRVGPDTTLSVLLIIWAAATFLAACYWVWRKLTYRIGVRLFISYLLVGIVPFFIVFGFAAAISYIVAGQYASVRYSQLEERVMWELGRVAEDARGALENINAEAARRLLVAASEEPPHPLPRLEWVLATDSGSLQSDPALELPLPSERTTAGFRGAVASGGRIYLAAAERADRGWIVAYLPANLETARSLSDEAFFELRFLAEDGNQQADEEDPAIEQAAPTTPSSSEVVEQGWTSLLVGEGSPLERFRVLWFRLDEAPVSWSEEAGWDDNRVTLLRLPVTALLGDLFGSEYELQDVFGCAVVALGTLFLLIYLAVVGLAALLVFNVTSSAARLSRGAKAVGAGRLDYRIPVHQRDQLGDLAVAFNTMTESVEEMIQGIAEKERLARELEVAAEIQLGLLPALEQEHGQLAVRAHFQPAAEVGGDYFDLFPLSETRLLVPAGDVAGHGLSTSLLMAMVKSAVATLVAEGHYGADLLQRLNAVVRRQSDRTHMVTLALADIDTEAQEVHIVSAGHPPAFALLPGGQVVEALLGSLPLGHPWKSAPQSMRLPFPPGSRLLLYSDGLVEAPDREGQLYGYERLREELEQNADLSAGDLVSHLLVTLREHSGGESWGDDLTLVAVEHLCTRPADGQTQSPAGG